MDDRRDKRSIFMNFLESDITSELKNLQKEAKTNKLERSNGFRNKRDSILQNC